MVLGPPALEDAAQGRSLRTIVIIRFSSIGDIVLTHPVYLALKAGDPDVRLVAVVRRGYESLIAANPYADLTMVLDPDKESLRAFTRRLRALAPDMVIDLHDNLRSRMIRNRLGARQILVVRKFTFKRLLLVLFKINLLKSAKRVVERYLETVSSVTAGKKGRIESFFEVPGRIVRRLKRTSLKNAGTGFVAVCKEAGWMTKRWPHYDELIRILLEDKKQTVVLLGQHRDESLRSLEKKNPGRFYNLTGRLDIIASAAVISLSRVFITNDTGLMHIADAMKKKTLSIWGPTVFEFGFEPVNASTKVVSNEKIRCRPCSLHGSDRCPLRHFRCMSTITPVKIAGLAAQN